MAVAALRFHEVRKTYAGAVALDAFTLSIEAGECFGLVGVNGAGKTTLLKCVLDFCEADSGSIDIFGVSHELTAARAPLAYLPEHFNPPHYLTGRDFLQYMAKMHRGAYSESAALDMAKALDLDPAALDKAVRAYSKGMNQKLGLAACLLSRKALYLFDEPTSGLDPRARILLKRRLSALHDEGRTVFFTSHSLADVEDMCNRVAVIDGGRLCFTGTPETLKRSQNADSLEQAFMALVAHEVSVP